MTSFCTSNGADRNLDIKHTQCNYTVYSIPDPNPLKEIRLLKALQKVKALLYNLSVPF